MTELLLRGEQTLGELRTRAARMEPINDIQHMSELFAELKRRNLVVELSPPGRGQIVSHNLYPEWELEQVRKSVVTGTFGGSEESSSTAPSSRQSSTSSTSNSELVGKLETEIENLKSKVIELSNRLDRLEKDLGVS